MLEDGVRTVMVSISGIAFAPLVIVFGLSGSIYFVPSLVPRTLCTPVVSDVGVGIVVVIVVFVLVRGGRLRHGRRAVGKVRAD